MLLYRPKQKISTTASEEVKFPASSIDGLATVATSGSYNDLTDKPGIPDMPDILQTTGTSTTAVMSQKAVTDELNTKANSADLAQVATSGNYDDLSNKPPIPTDYVKYTAQTLTDAQKSQARSNIGAGTSNFDGTWGSLSGKPNVVQSTGQSTSDVMSQKAVTDELNKKANSTDLAQYVPNTRKVNNKALSSDITLGASDVGALPTAGGTVTGNLTVGGNLTINGTTTTVDSTTLQVKDKLIEVAHGNTTTLTTPAGLVAPKYDGTNSGALVFDSTGTAYVGDVTLKDGNIDVANSGLQPLATRTGLVGGNLVQYDSSAQTLKDSGKKISDLATTSQVNAKYTKPSGGIPKTDLAGDVQTSLGKADSALQAKDISGKANLSGGNTFTGKQTLTNPASDGYSIDASGYVKGSWLQSSAISNKGGNTGKVCVFDNSGWIYYRTPSEILAEAGGAKASDIKNGTLTIQKNGTKVATFGANQSTNETANITVPTKVGELENDSGYTTNKGTVTSVSVKMNGASKGTVTNSGTIDLGTVITAHQDISGKLDKTTYEVNKTIDFGSSGVLYVGKFKVYDTNVTCEVTSTTNVTYSGKLVIATQNYGIAQMTVYGDAANTVAPNFFVKPSTTSNPYIEVYFKPSSWSKNVVHIYGSNIQAEPTNVCTNVSAVPSTATLKPKNALADHYVTTDIDQDIKGKKTVIPPANKDNSNQIATTAWAGRRYKSIADFGFTSQTTVKAIVQKIIDNWYEYCTFACTNDNFNNFSDTPDGYGTLIIEVGSNALRPLISFTKQIGDSNGYKHWQANIVRGANNQVTNVQWYEIITTKNFSLSGTTLTITL